MDYKIPENLSKGIIKKLCSDSYDYDELIKLFFDHLKKINKLDKNIEDYDNLTKDQKKNISNF